MTHLCWKDQSFASYFWAGWACLPLTVWACYQAGSHSLVASAPDRGDGDRLWFAWHTDVFIICVLGRQPGLTLSVWPRPAARGQWYPVILKDGDSLRQRQRCSWVHVGSHAQSNWCPWAAKCHPCLLACIATHRHSPGMWLGSSWDLAGPKLTGVSGLLVGMCTLKLSSPEPAQQTHLAWCTEVPLF